METACPICLEEFNDNKYEINCRPGKPESKHTKHVICNSCESAMRQAARPTLRVKKGESHRQIKCPLCRGVETVENLRSAASYKAELESLYLLMIPPVPERSLASAAARRAQVRQEAEDMRNRRIAREQMREAVANSLREHARDTAMASQMLALDPLDPVAAAARIHTTLSSVAAPGVAPVVPVVPVAVARVGSSVPMPAVPVADTGNQKMWCVFKRNGIACATLSKTKRKCCAPLDNGYFCQEKVCRSCNKCDWH